MAGFLDTLLKKDAEVAHGFEHATFHQVAALIAGQLERMIFLLGRQHADMPPLSDSRAYVAATAQPIYTANNRQVLQITGLSTNAAAASNVTVSFLHESTGPRKQQVYAAAFPTNGGTLIPMQEFILPAGAILYITSDQAGTINFNATVFDMSQPNILENYQQ